MDQRLEAEVEARRRGGPHDEDAVLDAAAALGELVRLLNQATRSQPRSASAVASVLGELATATDRMDQLLGQLAGRLLDVADSASVYDDRPGLDPQATVAGVQEALRQAGADADGLTQRLETAHRMAAHLGGRAADETGAGS